MSRPIQFRQLPGNRGLVFGNAIVQGVNNGINNYNNMHLRNLQAESLRDRNTMMGKMYQQRAELMSRQNLSANMNRVTMAHDYAKYLKDTGNPEAAKSVLKSAQPIVDSLVQNMPAEQAAALRSKIQQEIQSGQAVPELAGEMDLNQNEQKALAAMNSNDTKLGVAGTNAGARIGAANIYGESRDYGYDRELEGKKYSADAGVKRAKTYGGYRTKGEAMKDLTSQMNQTAKSLSPTNPFAQQLDPEAKKMMQDRFNDLHSQYGAVLGSDPEDWQEGAPAPQKPSTPAQSAPAGPQMFPASQWDKAPKGSVIQHSDGTKYQSLGDGNFVPYTAPAVPLAPAE